MRIKQDMQNVPSVHKSHFSTKIDKYAINCTFHDISLPNFAQNIQMQ